jgi:hypothetical protein
VKGEKKMKKTIAFQLMIFMISVFIGASQPIQAYEKINMNHTYRHAPGSTTNTLQTKHETVKLEKIFVWKSINGAVYHCRCCSHLRKVKIKIGLKEAIEKSLRQCATCLPPKGIEKKKAAQKTTVTKPSTSSYAKNRSISNKRRRNSKSSTQCTAYTKKGNRCKRTVIGNSRCWQHR